ncbi:MAG: hypothetical protein WA435_04695 [Gallionellaceae bacterium]
MSYWRFAGLAACLFIGYINPTLANIVADPGFEDCTYDTETPPPDWTATSNPICTTLFPNSGSYETLFFAWSGSLSQSIAPTIGDSYDFSFWILNGNGNNPEFTGSFGADEVLDYTASPPYLTRTFEDFTVLATASLTTISFDNVGSQDFFLDDVSVTPLPGGGTTVPEPATLPC